MVCIFNSCYVFLFIYLLYVVTDMREESKAATVPMVPIAPISIVPITFILVGLGNLLALVPYLVKL